MKTALLLLSLCATSLLAGEPRKGTICFGTDCAPATGSTFEVKPADVERRFVWMSSDASNVVLGTLAAKAATVDLDAKDAHNLTLSVRGDAARGWPVETRFTIGEGKDNVWHWSVPAKLTGKPASIRIKRGTYRMQIAAERHKEDRRPFSVDASDVALHLITLAPLPAVNGHVVTMKKSADDKEPKETPVAGAHLAGSDGKTLGATNEQGTFHVELPEPVTKEMVILSPGLGMRVVPLNILTTDTDLGAITLSSGVKLNVHIDRAGSVKSKPLHVQLTEASKTQYENTRIATREIKVGDDDLVFADLSEGEYYLTLNGDGALEHLTTAISISHEDVSKTIRLAPFQLQGTVHLGSEPLREGSVGVHDRNHTWDDNAAIDGEGRFGGSMWQSAGIGGWVNSKATGTLPVDDDPQLTGDPATWDITFKRRFITGRIFDEETKQPIAKSSLKMQLETSSQGGVAGVNRLYTGARVDDDGRYSIAATRDGIYDLSAAAPDYINEKKTIELADRDEGKTADFPLSHGIEQAVEFVWPSGEPVANAMVLEGVARDGHNAAWMGSTDPTGRLNLRIRAGDTKTLFIVPREGSFAPVHVIAADAKPIRVVVPQPAASLLIHYEDAEKKPILGRTAIRWNGEWVPQSVVMRLPISRVGPGSLRFALLPAGSYEIWGVKGSIQPLLAPPPRDPVRIGLTTGEQAIEIVVPN